MITLVHYHFFFICGCILILILHVLFILIT